LLILLSLALLAANETIRSRTRRRARADDDAEEADRVAVLPAASGSIETS
jgi:hypothetical protein